MDHHDGCLSGDNLVATDPVHVSYTHLGCTIQGGMVAAPEHAFKAQHGSLDGTGECSAELIFHFLCA